MAKHLDLEEQEQLDQIKHFWKQYGNTITWVLIVVLGAFAAWNSYQYWQRSQASQASALYDEVDRIARSGDMAQLDRALADMKSRYPKTIYAQQAGLVAAKVYADAGKLDLAMASLKWLTETAADDGYRAIARLRLSALLVESKALDQALQQLEAPFPAEFGGLASDRKGDIFVLQGKKSEAKSEYQKAYAALDEKMEYRRLVEVKLNALGVDPVSGAALASASEVKK